jgi:hypothetical protein
VALGQVFPEYFGFPCESSFHQLLHNHPHLPSGAGTIGQKWPQYNGLSRTPLAIKKIRKKSLTPLNIQLCSFYSNLQEILTVTQEAVQKFISNLSKYSTSIYSLHFEMCRNCDVMKRNGNDFPRHSKVSNCSYSETVKLYFLNI